MGLTEGNAQLVKEKTELALSRGIKAELIIKQGLMQPMKIIGQKFRTGEIFIPDVLMSSRAMHASLHVLKPHLTFDYKFSKGTIVIGTVAGDLHDIGKNMVSMILQSEGYKVVDLGIDVPAEGFITAVTKYKPDVLALSALLTTTMAEQHEVMNRLTMEGIRNQVKVIVGGGPITKEFAEAIGADAYASDMFSTIDAVKNLIPES
nr:corrinoid protein [Alkalibaculum sporogenes]